VRHDWRARERRWIFFGNSAEHHLITHDNS